MLAKNFLAIESHQLNQLSHQPIPEVSYDFDSGEPEYVDTLADQVTNELLKADTHQTRLYGAALDIVTNKYQLQLDDYIGILINPDHPTTPKILANFICCRQEIKAIMQISSLLKKGQFVTVIDVKAEQDANFGPPFMITTGASNCDNFIIKYSEDRSPDSFFPARYPEAIVVNTDSTHRIISRPSRQSTKIHADDIAEQTIDVLSRASDAKLSVASFYDRNPLDIDTHQPNRIVAIGDDAIRKALDGIRRKANTPPELLMEARLVIAERSRTNPQ